MASDDNVYSAESQATIDKWRRNKEHSEMVGEAITRKLKEVHAKALKNPETKKNLAREILGAYKHQGKTAEHKEGYLQSEEGIITGYEPKPWEDDE